MGQWQEIESSSAHTEMDITSGTGNFLVISFVSYWADKRKLPGRSRTAA